MVVHLVSSKMLVRLYSRIFFLVKYCTQDYYIWLNKPNLIEFDIMCNCYNITSLLFINSLLLCSFCVSFYGSQPFCQIEFQVWGVCLDWVWLIWWVLDSLDMLGLGLQDSYITPTWNSIIADCLRWGYISIRKVLKSCWV